MIGFLDSFHMLRISDRRLCLQSFITQTHDHDQNSDPIGRVLVYAPQLLVMNVNNNVKW